MSQKPWPQLQPKQDAAVECKEIAEVPKPWPQSPQWPPKDCGQAAVAKVEATQETLLARQTETTVSKVPKGLTPFKPGQSGNIKGRPKGSKHKITEAVRSIVLADVAEHGASVLARIREEDPVSWFAIIMKFVPAELILKLEKGLGVDYSGLSDEEFVELAEKRKRNWMMNTVLEKYGDR
jgi:hypothetical protein